MNEILNIEYHVKRMVIKALNQTQSHEAAGRLLGVTGRTVYRYKRQFDIVYDAKRNEYKFKSQQAVVLK